MKILKQFCFTIALLMLISIILPACSIPSPATATAEANTIASQALSINTPQIAMSTLTPCTTPAYETLSQTPSPTPFLAPTNPPAETIGYVLNEYTASDGKYIYYSDGKNVYRMDLDGKNIKKTAIKRFHEFIAITEEGFYFTQDDIEYKLTNYECNLQYCPAFNLQYYDKMTGKTKTKRTHIAEAVNVAGKIYTINHLDHAKILAFDIKSKKTNAITASLPPDSNEYQSIWINGFDDLPYVSCDSFPGYNYIILDNKIQKETAKPTTSPVPSASPIINYTDRILYDQNTERYSIWTNSKYEEIKYKTIDNIYDFGDRYIINTMDWDKLYQTGVLNIALYMYSTNGAKAKILEKSFEQISVSAKTECVNGWLFIFWDSGPEGGTADEIIIKYKIS